jgi:hypothetical protein
LPIDGRSSLSTICEKRLLPSLKKHDLTGSDLREYQLSARSVPSDTHEEHLSSDTRRLQTPDPAQDTEVTHSTNGEAGYRPKEVAFDGLKKMILFVFHFSSE